MTVKHKGGRPKKYDRPHRLGFRCEESTYLMHETIARLNHTSRTNVLIIAINRLAKDVKYQGQSVFDLVTNNPEKIDEILKPNALEEFLKDAK